MIFQALCNNYREVTFRSSGFICLAAHFHLAADRKCISHFEIKRGGYVTIWCKYVKEENPANGGEEEEEGEERLKKW